MSRCVGSFHNASGTHGRCWVWENATRWTNCPVSGAAEDSMTLSLRESSTRGARAESTASWARRGRLILSWLPLIATHDGARKRGGAQTPLVVGRYVRGR